MKRSYVVGTWLLAIACTRTAFAAPTAQALLPGDVQRTTEVPLYTTNHLFNRENKKHIFISPLDLTMYLAGQIQVGYLYGAKIRTLDDRIPDLQARFRQRMSLEFYSQFGKRHFDGEVAADMCLKLHQMHWWRDGYSNLLIKFYRITTQQSVFSFSDAWLAVHFGAWMPGLADHPHSLQVGYFPYQLGRGVSLGFADEGGIKYLGFDLTYDPIESAYYTPGVLWKGKVNEAFGYEFYYSLMSQLYEPFFYSRTFDQSMLFSQRLDLNRLNRFGKNLGRAVWSGKLTVDATPAHDLNVHAEPYFLWFNSTLGVDDFQRTQTDRTIRLGTYGMMIDCTYKRFNFNIEAAGQLGELELHPIDNNTRVVLRDPLGNNAIRYSFATDVVRNERISASNDLEAVIDNPTVKTAPGVGQLLVSNNDLDGFAINKDTGALESFNGFFNRLVSVGGEGSTAGDQIAADMLDNVAVGFSDIERLRPAQTLDLKGFMVLFDACYRCDCIPFVWNFAVAYLSGDKSPLIDLDNGTALADPTATTYRGFLPLRDNRYRGHAVKSFTYLTMRTIERPATTGINFNDTSNLFFFGFGFDCFPIKPRNKLHIFSDIIWFFQPLKQRKLPRFDIPADPTVVQPFASEFLSTEINGSVSYRFLEACTLLLRGAVFIPGRLYEDMQNQAKLYQTTSGSILFQRGKDISYAYHVRLSYDF